MNRSSIKTKFSILMIVYFIVIFISNFLLTKVIAKKIQYTQLEKLTKKTTETISLNIAPHLYNGDIRGVYENIKSFLEEEDVVFCTVKDTLGKIISKVSSIPLIPNNVTIKEEPIVFNGVRIGTLSAGFLPLRKRVHIGTALLYISILTAVVFLVIVLILIASINKVFLNPITELSKKMNQMSIEKLPEEIEIERRDEIGTIYSAFNRMVKNLKKSRYKVTEVESLYKLLFENAKDAIFFMDKEKFIDVNPAGIELFGCKREDIIGKSPADFSPSIQPDGRDSKKKAKEKISLALSGIPQIFEWLHRRKNGEDIYTEVSLNRILFKGKIILLAIVRDITKWKKSKDKLMESERKFRSVVENAEEGLIMIGDNYRITYVNKKLCEITGYSEEEIIGRDFRGLLAGKSKKLVAERYRLRRKGKKIPVRYEIQVLRKDREIRDCSMSVSVIETERGEKLSVGVLLDITEKRKLERELFLSQRLESIGRLTGGIAHDFNNILTAISGYAELSLDAMEKDNPARADIEEILKSTNKAASLTQKLLAFSRKQIMKPLTINLNNVIEELDKMLQRVIGDDIEFLTFLNENLWNIYVDPSSLEQVIMNLVVNARDAMPEGGKLIIETANIELTEKYVKKRHPVAMPGDYVMLSISDTGVGIPEDIKEHIFEPFFTTKEEGKGTGLGLSTVYGIVKQSGGFIWCYSEVGQGTTFKVYIPRAKGKKEKIKREDKGKFYIGGTETILIAEDNDEVRGSISRILMNYGYKVYEAKDGEEALGIAEEFKGKIDLIISDIIMPKMNGMKVAEGVKEHYPEVKVLYISGYTDNIITQKGILKPGINFLQKPFTTSLLLRKVREVLES